MTLCWKWALNLPWRNNYSNFRQQALEATANSGLVAAIEWLEKQPSTEQRETDENGKTATLKCDDCGKLFSSAERAQFHAFKTNHQSFSESTEVIRKLTPEESLKYLDELRAKRAAKKGEMALKDAEEAKRNEMIRRKAGKETIETKQKLQEKEMRLAAEQRAREKEEDRLAKARIKAQIEADRLERKQKTHPPPVKQDIPIETAKIIPSSCRIQVRLPNGTMVRFEFDAKDSISKLFSELSLHGAYTKLISTFPRQTITKEDAEKTFVDLNLIPSASLVAQ